ncbi:hypothetical protein [Undibacterium sp. TS12]|uniref:hypothetical protein n=1 Tax=Undibacterium sp. TS12 TaxID=2908202 RepID=UPI001F4D3034|nr:hypothetical protein [Undibacterium sp. TS12]MCH8621277.1 hypothetical protein [Undibacterium sp. TS12]
MECQRSVLSVMVAGIFAGTACVYAPGAMAGYEIVSNQSTPYVYQIAGASRKVIDVREERVIGATANTIHHGYINMDMAMVPVAANRGIDMLGGLRGIVPESQEWRVFALRGVNVKHKIDWASSESWVMTLDGVLLKNKLIADINWDNREITLAPMSNKTYAQQLARQDKQRSVLRLVTVRQQYETPEPLIALRLHPAQSALTEGRSLPVASVDVPVRTLEEVGDNRGNANIGVKMPDAAIDTLINQRVEQATREKMAQLEALEAQYREKLEQLNARSKQIKSEQPASNEGSVLPKPAAQNIGFKEKPFSSNGMMRADYRYPGPMRGGYQMTRLGWSSTNEKMVSDDQVMKKNVRLDTAVAVTNPVAADNAAASETVTPAPANVLSFPVQSNVEVTEPAQTKWEITLNDKTLRNALTRLASRNGYSLSYQTKDQEIKMGGTFFGTFDAALREIELATGKRIRQIESRLLGRLIMVTD